MVDNVTADPGSGGSTFATDDIGGVHYPITKLTFGALDSQTIASSNSGTADAGTQRVTVATDDDLMLGTDFSDVLGTTSLVTTAVLADAVATSQDVLNVRNFNYVYNGTTFDFVREGSTAGSILVDGSGVTQPISGTITADAGTNLNTSALLTTTNFSDVLGTTSLVTTAALADGVATGQDVLNVRNFNYCYNGTTFDFIREGATAGSILVDGSGVTQPVSGTVTANPASGTIDTVTSVTQFNGQAVSMGTGVRDAGTQRVTIATNDVVPASQSGTWNINNVSGTVSLPTGASTAANQSTAITALELIDNPIVAHDALASGATGTNFMGAYATNSIEGLTQVANADATRVAADLNGALIGRPHTTLEEIVTERDSITTNTSTNFAGAFAAPGANNHLYVTAISVVNSSATDTYIDFQDGSGGTVIWTMALPGNGGANMCFSTPLKVAANTALAYQVNTGVTTAFISVTGFTAQG